MTDRKPITDNILKPAEARQLENIEAKLDQINTKLDKLAEQLGLKL